MRKLLLTASLLSLVVTAFAAPGCGGDDNSGSSNPDASIDSTGSSSGTTGSSSGTTGSSSGSSSSGSSSGSSSSSSSSSSGSSSGGTDGGDAGSCAAATVATPPAYVPVSAAKGACTAGEVKGITICDVADKSYDPAKCQTYLKGVSKGCAACMTGSAEGGAAPNAGAFLTDKDFTPKGIFYTNTAACIAVEDQSASCASYYFPAEECVILACQACSAGNVGACQADVKSQGFSGSGPCASEIAGAIHCAKEVADGGVIGAKCNTLAEVVDVVCGKGP